MSVEIGWGGNRRRDTYATPEETVEVVVDAVSER